MQQITSPITLITIFKPLNSPLISTTHKTISKTHFKNQIISAKWGKNRSGSQKSHKLIISSIAYIASTLKILPEPFDSLVREFLVVGGGNGGKIGFRKFSGGGGGGGRNKRGKKIGLFWAVLLVSSSLALWVVLEKERDSSSELGFRVFGFLVFAVVVYCLVKEWKKEVKIWVLGFCCGVALMGFGIRNNDNFVKCVDEFRANYLIIKKKKRGRRWI